MHKRTEKKIARLQAKIERKKKNKPYLYLYKPYKQQEEFHSITSKIGILRAGNGCIAERHIIDVTRNKTCRRWALDRLYDNWHGINRIFNYKDSLKSMVRSFDGKNFFLNELYGVVYSGEKQTVRVILDDGTFLECTPDHLILSDHGWVEASESLGLNIVCKGKRGSREKVRSKRSISQERYVKYHKYGPRKRVYTLIFEAYKNGLTYNEYVKILRKDKQNAASLFAINNKTHCIHHINGDRKDNRLENLKYMSIKAHNKLHAKDCKSKFIVSQKKKVVLIEDAGIQKTYDLQVKAPHHNFVINDIVVHNSGKTCAGCNEVLMEGFGENPYREIAIKKRKLIWVAGDTMSNVEEIIMQKMYEWLPPEALGRWKYRTRPRPLLELFSPKGRVIARILLKSYEQGRKAFQGAEPDLILLDEEPPEDIWTEIYARTRAGGKIRITATPFGYGLIAKLLEDMEEDDSITDIQAHINDNIYLDKDERERQIKKYGSEINRIDGSIWIPEGVVYKTPIDVLYIDKFDKMDYQSESNYPDVWQLWEGIDLGGTDPFCCLFGLYNPATDVLVIVGEHYLKSSDIPMHRRLIGATEVKIKEAYGVPVCHSRKFDNNNKVAVREFIVQGLHGSEVEKGSGSVEAGILLTRQRTVAGKLKIVKGSAPNLEKEYRLYRYSTRGDGKPARHQQDHAVTALRYICQYLRPLKKKKEKKRARTRRSSSNYFLGRMG